MRGGGSRSRQVWQPRHYWRLSHADGQKWSSDHPVPSALGELGASLQGAPGRDLIDDGRGLAHDPSVLATLLLLVLGTTEPSPRDGGESSKAESNDSNVDPRDDDDRRISGGWFALRPIGIALPGPGHDSDIQQFRSAVGPSYRWGFSAGASFEPVTGLFINVAAGFDQSIWSFRNTRIGAPQGYADPTYSLCFRGDCYGWTERVLGTLLRVGVELRLGWVDRRWLVWATVEPQLAVSRLRLECDDARSDHCGRKSTDVGPGFAGGVGVAWRIIARFALGLEGECGHAWLERRDDPFRALRTCDLGVIAALRF